MKKKSFPLGNAYGLPETGTVVLITTSHKGTPNIMTQSWHTMMEFEPPLVGCVLSGRKVDKFARTGLTAVTSSQMQAPLIAECYASLECRVANTRLVNENNFFVLEVIKAWIDPSVKNPQTMHHRGAGEFMVACKSRVTMPLGKVVVPC